MRTINVGLSAAELATLLQGLAHLRQGCYEAQYASKGNGNIQAYQAAARVIGDVTERLEAAERRLRNRKEQEEKIAAGNPPF